ncbi:MAG: hypothetical protein AABM43_12150 [Actinomycetota bacterium]
MKTALIIALFWAFALSAMFVLAVLLVWMFAAIVLLPLRAIAAIRVER